MSPSFPFEHVSYPCFELNAELRIVDCNAAAEGLAAGRDMFRLLLSEDELARLLHGQPVQLAWNQMPGLVRSVNILPLPAGYAALLQAVPEREQGYLRSLEHTVGEAQGMFAALPMVRHFIEDGSQGVQLLEYAVRQCYRILRTVNDQAWSVRLAGSSPLNCENIELNELLGLLCSAVNEAMPDLERPIRFEEAGVPLPVYADRSLLELIVTHLLNNSVSYTADGNEICVRLQQMGSRAVVHVTDSGKGIKPEIASRIFEPYFSSDPYCDTEEVPGSGLGLYLVQQGLRAMGGEVALESEFGRGTHVSFTLPLAEGEQEVHARLSDYLMDRLSCVYLQFCPLGARIRL